MVATLPDKKRALVVSQDNLLAFLGADQVDFIRLSGSITPNAQSSRSTPLFKVIQRLWRRDYALIIFPAVSLSWHDERSFAKGLLRRFLNLSVKVGIADLLLKFLSGWRQRIPLAVIDRYDRPILRWPGTTKAAVDIHYFKTNVPREWREEGSIRFHFLPLWIQEDNYPSEVTQEREYDVVFACTINSQTRYWSMQALQELQADYKIVIHDKPIPFDEYLRLSSRSWLIASPEGCGYHGFRHYEAMWLGSVPLINKPEIPLITNLEHGVNCLLYDRDGAALKALVTNALADKEALLAIGKRGAAFARSHHTVKAVGALILQKTLEGAAPVEKR